MPRPQVYHDIPTCDCGNEKNVVEHYGERHVYCPDCNEPFPDLEIPESDKCELCGEQKGGTTHHVSYVYNVTIDVCSQCHNRIHDTTDKYSEYQPRYSRSEAVEAGMIEKSR